MSDTAENRVDVNTCDLPESLDNETALLSPWCSRQGREKDKGEVQDKTQNKREQIEELLEKTGVTLSFHREWLGM